MNQPPVFTLNYDASVEDKDEVVLSDEEIEEGISQWKLTLVATVVGTKVTKESMEKFIAAQWKQITTPIVSKKSGIFLLRFSTEEDMLRILELPLNFIFGKPLLLKKYKVGMKLGKGFFK